jgi:hypothetical protein
VHPRRQRIDQPRYRLFLPSHVARESHAVALVEPECDCVFPHTQIEIAARGFHDLTHELLEDPPASAIELTAVENLMKHDRASGHLHAAHAGSFPVPLECDNYAVLEDALVRLDAVFESVLPNVRESVPMRLEMPVDRTEVTETRVSHGYRFRKTKIGSLLKALFPMCFSPTILLI